MKPTLQSFPPVIDQDSRLIILGTMPGVVSLQKQQYYGHPQNQFWTIVHALFNVQPSAEYQDRLRFLLDHHMALWDVLSGCDREGSLDSNIRNEQPNDFAELFACYPRLHYVMFNGGKAEQLFKKYVGFDVASKLSFHRLPSTSPTHTRPFQEKYQAWLVIRRYLTEKMIHGCG